MHRVQGHGALAALPRAGQLVAARAAFDNASTPDNRRADAARVMADFGTAFDKGRARSWLRDAVVDRAG